MKLYNSRYYLNYINIFTNTNNREIAIQLLK